MRAMVAQTSVEPRQLILPVFVAEGLTEPRPISSMPGVVQHTLDTLRKTAVEAAQAGLPIVLTDQYGAAPLLFTDPDLRARFVLPVDDRARWVEAVRSLLDDAGLRRQVSDHVCANAERLTIAASVDRVLDRLAGADVRTTGGRPADRAGRREAAR